MSLILTRRVGETLMIGNDVTVTIVGCHGQQVRLAVKAPREMSVDREEIRARKDAGLPPVLHMPRRRS